MRTSIRLVTVLSAMIAMSQFGAAQAPAGAPAGATALCNDGTYFTGATKSGGCRGHKGIKTWYGPSSGTASKASASSAKSSGATTAVPAPSPAPKAQPNPAPSAASPSKTAALANPPQPGGGPGQVWLNTASNVYHCPGTQYYGKTKAGMYLTEAEAKAKGARPDHGKPCSKQ